MIISRISDGLGNQMFMYACGYALAKQKDENLVLDASLLDNHKSRNFDLQLFNITYSKLISFKKFPLKYLRSFLRFLKDLFFECFFNSFYEKKTFSYNKDVFNISKNTYLSGYWQCEKYFKDYRDDLLRIFTPKIPRDESVVSLYSKMLEDEYSVSLHIRRGDYVGIGCHLNFEFYIEAIKLMAEKLGVAFNCYVFSDDIEFCKERLVGFDSSVKFIYPEYNSDNTTFDDLLLMSKCKHNIVANSSYSWWGAWLNQNDKKIVICPDINMWTGDFYPEEWIKIKI